MIEIARNLADLARELLDAVITHTCGHAIDTATASPLHGHVDHLHLKRADQLTGLHA